MTIYVGSTREQPVQTSQLPDEVFFVTTRGTGTIQGKSAKVVSGLIVNRPEVNPASNAVFGELTIIGDKGVLDNFMKEYDTGETDFRRYICTSQTLMETSSDAYGVVVDYNPSFTPIVGVSKPKNFRLINRGVGFNPDSDIVLSRGRTGSATPYNATFGFSYFNPVFFTRLKLEKRLSLVHLPMVSISMVKKVKHMVLLKMTPLLTLVVSLLSS